jgi:hypothetical protein
VLVRLGADLSRVRQRVIELASGAPVPAPPTEGEDSPVPVSGPRCSRCRASLSEYSRYTSIEAAPDNVVEGRAR